MCQQKFVNSIRVIISVVSLCLPIDLLLGEQLTEYQIFPKDGALSADINAKRSGLDIGS